MHRGSSRLQQAGYGAALVLLICLAPASCDVFGSISNAISSGVSAASSAANTASGVVNSVTSVVGSVTQGVGALAPATASAANSASSSLQGNLTSLTNNSPGIFASGTSAITNLTRSAEQTVASAAGPALASGEKAITNITAVSSVVGGPIASAIESVVRNGTRHPLVFWPGFGTSIVNVAVSNNSAANCPSNGTFQVGFGQASELNGFPERCIYPLLTIQHNGGLNFSNPPGVNSTIRGFGDPSCAPIPYAVTYAFLEGVGYQPGKDFFVACYDWRTTPFTDVGSDGAHLQRARQLVEQAYNNTNGTKVYLMAHSNGPLYALALLSSMSAQWRQTYIAGYIPIAGNWIGQGSTYSFMVSGQSLFDSSPNAASAPAFASWPSTYMSASFPSQYNESETIIVHQGAMNYTPADSSEFYEDAGIPNAATLAPMFQGNMTPSNTSPGTNFYGFYGSGLPTLVGATYSNLSVGATSVNGGNVYLDGDGNQEYIDNLAALRWNSTLSPCYHYELNEIRGVNHLLLPLNPSVLQKVTNIVYSNPPSSQCAAAPAPSTTTSVTRSG